MKGRLFQKGPESIQNPARSGIMIHIQMIIIIHLSDAKMGNVVDCTCFLDPFGLFSMATHVPAPLRNPGVVFFLFYVFFSIYFNLLGRPRSSSLFSMATRPLWRNPTIAMGEKTVKPVWSLTFSQQQKPFSFLSAQ